MTNNRPKLTIKQQRVHAFLKHFLKENGYPPTVREISDGLNLAGPNSSKKYLDILVRKGYIRKTAKSSRAIELLTEHPDTNIHMLPVIGTIQAGSPLLAIENISAHVAVDASLVRSTGMFVLKINGDSMIDAHIMDGDLVLVRPQAHVEQGEIAAVLIDEEATVKYFFRDESSIRLQPANQALQPLTFDPYSTEIRIMGKVTALIRTLD